MLSRPTCILSKRNSFVHFYLDNFSLWLNLNVLRYSFKKRFHTADEIDDDNPDFADILETGRDAVMNVYGTRGVTLKRINTSLT